MSKPSLSTVQLQCFVRVADTGSFAEAGRHLGLSTSGVSRVISRMEYAQGVRLLNRSTHSLSLTPEGEELIDLARKAVQSIAQVNLAMAAAHRGSARGRVRIGAPTAFLRTCIAPLLPEFRSAHPDILLDLRGSDHMVDLAQDAMDVVLRSGALEGTPGHLRQTLFDVTWVACASPAYLSRRCQPMAPADLAAHDLIGFRNQRTGIVDPWRFGGPLERDRVEIRRSSDFVLVLDDGNAIAAAAVAGAGIVWTPQWLVADFLRTGELVPLLTRWECERKTMALIRRDHPRHPKRVDQTIAFLKEQASSFVRLKTEFQTRAIPAGR